MKHTTQIAGKLALCFVWMLASQTYAQPFRIVHDHKSVSVILDQQDAEVVGIAGAALAGDIELITGIQPSLSTLAETNARSAIIIGTLGKSSLIDDLVDRGKISKAALAGQWETFQLQVVEKPFPGMDQALVIAGSDPRGTAFGVFELSKRLGVSPWVYWADVTPAKSAELSVELDEVVMGPPSVKFRGIFLNDEDWGLQPWAAKNLDTDIKDIGPKTYARIFELMLRLKANYIWPAMHSCTKAFFYYPENVTVAARYGIVMGSSHCEPMLRNNVDEWKNNFASEYGKEPGPWRYDTNREDIKLFWEDRVKEVAEEEVDAVFTIGMRGLHDYGIQGATTTEGKMELVSQAINDQRALLAEHLNKDAADIPQIFCPYKEVLTLYNAGLKVPDDATLVWPDDNHGYMRKLSTPEEQKRSGRSGVYYHLSYWGPPGDFNWLSSFSPALISYEMSKAYRYGADRLWVFNVGDIKPAELEIEFAMDLAWDVEAWSPEKAMDYLEPWAARTFGNAVAAEIARIKTEYYRLAASGKPEHMYMVPFTSAEMEKRLAAYRDLYSQATELSHRIPDHLQDAYFQLILYPVAGAAKMSEKHLYARMGEMAKAQDAYQAVKTLTAQYNQEIAGGKWNGIMGLGSRGRTFQAPVSQEDANDLTSAYYPTSKTPKVKKGVAPLILDLKDGAVTEPMTLQEGVLGGISPKICDKSNGGLATITFHSAFEGSRDLYFMAQTPSVEEDSWFVSVNDQNVVVNNHVTGENWKWIKAGAFELKKGDNVLAISQREPHAKIRGIQFGNPALNANYPALSTDKPITIISVTDLQIDSGQLQVIPGLGVSGNSLSYIEFDAPSYTDAANAPLASIQLQLPVGKRRVKLICVPTHAIHEGRALRTAIRLGDNAFNVVDVNSAAKSKAWKANVIRGYSTAEAEFEIKEGGEVVLQLALLDPGLAISRIVIY